MRLGTTGLKRTKTGQVGQGQLLTPAFGRANHVPNSVGPVPIMACPVKGLTAGARQPDIDWLLTSSGRGEQAEG